MSKLRQKQRLIALGVTFLLHALLMLVLYFLVLRPKVQHTHSQELVILDIGQVEAAQGQEEPMGLEGQTPEPESIEPSPIKPSENVEKKVLPPVSKVQPKPQVREDISTQTHEESLRLREEARSRKQKQEAEALRKQQQIEKEKEAVAERLRKEQQIRKEQLAEAERLRKEQAERERNEKRQAIGNSVANAFGAGRNKSGSHGNDLGAGNQGDISGRAGGSFSLEGRRIVSNGGNLKAPYVNKAIEGRIVVQIVVESNGTVSSASVSPRGTTIADVSVRNEAIQAAKATTFNPQEGGKSQSGTITYIYVRKQ